MAGSVIYKEHFEENVYFKVKNRREAAMILKSILADDQTFWAISLKPLKNTGGGEISAQRLHEFICPAYYCVFVTFRNPLNIAKGRVAKVDAPPFTVPTLFFFSKIWKSEILFSRNSEISSIYRLRYEM